MQSNKNVYKHWTAGLLCHIRKDFNGSTMKNRDLLCTTLNFCTQSACMCHTCVYLCVCVYVCVCVCVCLCAYEYVYVCVYVCMVAIWPSGGHRCLCGLVVKTLHCESQVHRYHCYIPLEKAFSTWYPTQAHLKQ